MNKIKCPIAFPVLVTCAELELIIAALDILQPDGDDEAAQALELAERLRVLYTDVQQ